MATDILPVIASIIAIIHLSERSFEPAAEVRNSSEHVAEAFQRIRASLAPMLLAVRETEDRINNNELSEDTCEAMIPVHRAIERALKEYDAVLQKLIPEPGASTAVIIWKAGYNVFQENKIKSIRQQLHEYVGQLALLHATGAHSANFSATERDGIQESRNILVPALVPQATPLVRKCRNLLSLDGSGISMLYILKGVMTRFNRYQVPPLKPCEVFDMIGGSGAGGLIAIMLGRLGMSIDECLEEYTALFKRIAAAREESLRSGAATTSVPISGDILTTAISQLVKAHGLEPGALLRDEENIRCHSFACAVAKDAHNMVVFKNFLHPGEVDRHHVTIVNAASAAIASRKIFQDVEFGVPPSQYGVGEVGPKTLIDEVWAQAHNIWAKNRGLEHHRNCVISIGVAEINPKRIVKFNERYVAAIWGLAKGSLRPANPSQPSLEDNFLQNRALGPYHRFNQSLEKLGWEGFSEAGGTLYQTCNYFGQDDRELEACARYLKRETFAQPEGSESLVWLTNNADHIYLETNSYWSHLTVSSHEIYEKIYEQCKNFAGKVSFHLLLEEFPDESPLRVQEIWMRLFCDKRGPHFEYPKGFTMATLYMLHFETFFEKRPKLDAGMEGITKPRQEFLKRFANWVPCRCDDYCRVTWNFANDIGMHRGGDQHNCVLVRLFVLLRSLNFTLDEQWIFCDFSEQERRQFMQHFAAGSFPALPVQQAVEFWHRALQDWINSDPQ